MRSNHNGCDGTVGSLTFAFAGVLASYTRVATASENAVTKSVFNHAIFSTNLHTSEVLKRHRATSERAIAGRVTCEAAITECAIPRISIAAIVGTLAEWAECGGNANIWIHAAV